MASVVNTEMPVVPIPPPFEFITLRFSYKEAQALLEITGFIGGPADTSLRRLFSDRSDSIREILSEAGVKPGDFKVEGAVYFLPPSLTKR